MRIIPKVRKNMRVSEMPAPSEKDSIVWNFRISKYTSQTTVYCRCKGQIITSKDCPCYGTPEFYGPERKDYDIT